TECRKREGITSMSSQQWLWNVSTSVGGAFICWLYVRYIWPLINAWQLGTERIAGNWGILDAETQERKGNLKIKQFGTRISATLHYDGQHQDYQYTGIYWHQQLLLTFRERDLKWKAGAFVLRRRADGSMTGRTLF